MLNLFDRFISRIFLFNFLGAIIVLTTLYISVDAMSNMMRTGGPGAAWAKYYFFLLPSVFHQLIPVACLIATIFTLSTMNRSNELTALFSLGLSLARISAPVLIIVAGISVFNFVLGNRIIPRANQKKNYTYYVEIKNKPGLYSTVKTNKIWYRSKNILFNIKTLDVEKNRAQQASFYYFNDDWRLVQLITAAEVNMVGAVWKLKSGTLTLFTEGASFPLTKEFSEKTISIDEELVDLKSSANSSEVQTLSELRRFIKKNKESGLDTLQYEVDYHAKYSFAFAAFVMAFLGIPFSVRHSRSGGVALSIGFCILLAFGYWALYSSGQALGRHGAVPPILSAWLPNIIAIGVSGWFLLRLKR